MKKIATKNFKRFWLGGIGLLLLMILSNVLLITNASPTGIGDHQSAGSADKINDIQVAWQQSGVLLYAKTSMLTDLLFISVYSFGALCGGILLRYDSRRFIARIGALVIAASIIFFITDYVETIAQTIQLFMMQGSDRLANIAASVGPAKNISFIVTLFGLLGTIIWDKFRNTG